MNVTSLRCPNVYRADDRCLVREAYVRRTDSEVVFRLGPTIGLRMWKVVRDNNQMYLFWFPDQDIKIAMCQFIFILNCRREESRGMMLLSLSSSIGRAHSIASIRPSTRSNPPVFKWFTQWFNFRLRDLVILNVFSMSATSSLLIIMSKYGEHLIVKREPNWSLGYLIVWKSRRYGCSRSRGVNEMMRGQEMEQQFIQ